MEEIFGNRRISLAREISKYYEEIYRGTISEVLEEIHDIKGEIVLVVEGNLEKQDYSNLDVISHIQLYLADGMSEMDAIKLVSKERGVRKSVIYQEYHIYKKKSW